MIDANGSHDDVLQRTFNLDEKPLRILLQELARVGEDRNNDLSLASTLLSVAQATPLSREQMQVVLSMTWFAIGIFKTSVNHVLCP